MLTKLFPQEANNHYTGHPIACWVLIAITLLTLLRSLLHMGLADGGAESIATIPLTTFSPNAIATVILLMALWGLSQFLLALVYLIVLWRYRALIPLIYLFILLEYTLRIVLIYCKPISLSGTAPGYIADFVMVPFAILMFILSLYPTLSFSRKKR